MSRLNSPSSEPLLPAEIWSRIFQYATTSLAIKKIYMTDYQPFYDLPTEGEYVELQEADRMLLSLSLVCRSWTGVALELLYRRIRLNHGMTHLSRALGGDGSGSVSSIVNHCGKWVKRVELSVTEHEDPSHPITPHEILQKCPNAEILVKLDDDLLPHDIQLNLDNILRFDWWSPWYRDGDHRFDIDGDDASRGLDMLRQVVARSPNLRYLSVACRRSELRVTNKVHVPQRIVLPSVTTLRIEGIGHSNKHILAELEAWDFPRLDTIVMASCLFWRGAVSSLLTFKGITNLELMDDQALFEEEDCLVLLLNHMPQLRELNFYVEFVLPVSTFHRDAAYPALRTVRLNDKINPLLRYMEWSPTSHARMRHIENHFSMFANPTFPSLDRIILHGDWNSIRNEEHLQLILQSIQPHGYRLEFSTGETVFGFL